VRDLRVSQYGVERRASADPVQPSVLDVWRRSNAVAGRTELVLHLERRAPVPTRVVKPDPKRIRTFASEAAFEKWLAAHHDAWPEVWIKIHKKGSGLESITALEAIDVALCWGWIDGKRKGFDDQSFLQRYTPRGPKSRWSRINQENVARLIAAGRMTPHGLRAVDAAKADGRWGAAYAPMRETTVETVPADLRAAIEAEPKALAMFRKLDKQNLFSLAFRVGAVKTAAGREKKIAALVAVLTKGEPIVAPRKKK
jgi:uncharacterized protein YdeI (YjbR/CyaY-like superfamily)